LPDIVSTAGTFGKQVVPADAAREDTFSAQSYWWLFRELLDRVKGHPSASLPGLFPTRNRRVRTQFDALEQAFEAELPNVVREAVAAEHPDAIAAILDGFTGRCVRQVLASLQELLASFAEDKAAAADNVAKVA
jgi:secernin